MLSDGTYVVLFNQFDMSGSLKAQIRQGGFTVRDGAITGTDGICQGMLPTGPISNQTELRIYHGLNTGYFEVRHEQGFRPRPLSKSEKLTLTKGPFAKFLRAFEKDLAHGMKNVQVNREYWVPGLAGYSLDGATVYIDSRLPDQWNSIPLIKYLLIHEVGEKAIMDKLGFDYGYAHNLILNAENAAVHADGHNPKEYEKYVWDFIRKYCENSKVPKHKRPPDLDPDRITHDRSIKDIMRHSLRKSRISTDLPRVASIAVKDPKTGNLLWGKRNDNGLYTMPGGHMNEGELPETAAKRELYEETGIATKKLKFLGAAEVKGQDDEPLMVYSFLLEKKCDTDTEQDPDEEVQDWEWIGEKGRLRLEEQHLMHVPPERNVTMALLDLNKSAKEFLKKADSLAIPDEKDDEKNQGWYKQMRQFVNSEKFKKRSDLSSDDLGKFFDEAVAIGDHPSIQDALMHPSSTHEHVQKIIDRVLPDFPSDSYDPASRNSNNTFVSDLDSAVRYGKFNAEQAKFMIDLAHDLRGKQHVEEHSMLARLGAEVDPAARHKKDFSNDFIEGVAKNTNLPEDSLHEIAKYMSSEDGLSSGPSAMHHFKDFFKNPNLTPEILDHFRGGMSRDWLAGIVKHPNLSREFAEYLASHPNEFVRQHAKHSLAGHGILSSDHESVNVKFGTAKARQMRDWIEAHGGSMHHKELAAIGLKPDDLGMGHLKGPTGQIKAEDVHKHINLLPESEYIVSHGKYGFDPHENYNDPLHPQHEQYRGVSDPDDVPDPADEQRHSGEPSRVFQLSVTPDHVRKMKDAGVWDTFKRMNHASVKSGHPVAPHIGLGWVRYTGDKNGIFVDEIQSDIGNSYVRRTRAVAKDDLARGMISQKEAEQRIKEAENKFPEDHYNKIKDIVFGGKDAGELLHEAFHQHLRDSGEVGTPVHMWTGKSKATISLGETDKPLPVHMTETYDKAPKKMGYTPAKYGEQTTESHWQHRDKPTQKTILRKSKKR